jgi:hypothetical protein
MHKRCKRSAFSFFLSFFLIYFNVAVVSEWESEREKQERMRMREREEERKKAAKEFTKCKWLFFSL